MDPLKSNWRVNVSNGRTLHATGVDPRDDDPLIGIMDTHELALAVVKEHNLLQRADFAGFSLVDLAVKLDDTEAELKRCHERRLSAEDFVKWILSMDDPDDAEGRTTRQRVNLSWIMEKAREVGLEGKE
jgi:hypothetical protein